MFSGFTDSPSFSVTSHVDFTPYTPQPVVTAPPMPRAVDFTPYSPQPVVTTSPPQPSKIVPPPSSRPVQQPAPKPAQKREEFRLPQKRSIGLVGMVVRNPDPPPRQEPPPRQVAPRPTPQSYTPGSGRSNSARI